MFVSEFSTEGLPAGDRFTAWVELGSRSLTPIFVRSDVEDDFPASIRALALGDVQVCLLTYPSLRVHRPPRLIRQSDPEAYQINLLLDGESGVRQSGRETTFGAGHFVLYDTSRPFDGWRCCPSDAHTITVQIPRALLPLPASHLDRLTAVPFSTRRGIGAALSRWLIDMTNRAREFTPDDAPTLSRVTVDLLAAVLAGAVEAEGMLDPRSRRRTLLLQINGFIEQHLGDPALSPRMVADAHHISLRHLQQLFAEEGVTPAGWIRRRRLERCHHDLTDPYLHAHAVRAIAARWGFTDPAHFTRAFRAAYGVTPREYRNDPGARESTTTVRATAMPGGSRHGILPL
ncbi:helix-turn-helix domain-containing protein [Dactylosporangium salmoneum]|uniref:Helix-turn-helix domain-containing protein n=2 Tax=Dactylosporangium salmoneum TaxID=53361 RepID=A0ABP5UZX8_9ACTN